MSEQTPTGAVTPPPGDPPKDFETDPLSTPERLGAATLGIFVCGGGGWAVFSTDNQAGSAVMVIVGAAFLLMAVQGTPLIRLGTGDNGVELDRRRRRVERAIEQARQEDSPEVAAGIVEGASIIEPILFRSPRYRGDLYESKIALALQEAGIMVSRRGMDYGPDLLAETSMGLAAIDVKYRERGLLGMRDIRQAESLASRFGRVGVLVVSNAPLSPEVERYNADENNRLVEAVTWNDEKDSGLLARALMRVMATSIRPPDAEGGETGA
ncbi:hypothetical protein [Micromonospora lupini]|uniref:hypothetical protein n=1 Tax=Micromonospora lupini TaxID=285679 RepID=UPI0033FBE7BF